MTSATDGTPRTPRIPPCARGNYNGAILFPRCGSVRSVGRFRRVREAAINAALQRLLRPVPPDFTPPWLRDLPPSRDLPPIPKVCEPDGLHVIDGSDGKEAPLMPDGSCRECWNLEQIRRNRAA